MALKKELTALGAGKSRAGEKRKRSDSPESVGDGRDESDSELSSIPESSRHRSAEIDAGKVRYAIFKHLSKLTSFRHQSYSKRLRSGAVSNSRPALSSSEGDKNGNEMDIGDELVFPVMY